MITFPGRWWALPTGDCLDFQNTCLALAPHFPFSPPGLPICKLLFSVCLLLQKHFLIFSDVMERFSFHRKEVKLSEARTAHPCWASVLPKHSSPSELWVLPIPFHTSSKSPALLKSCLRLMSASLYSDITLPPVFWLCSFFCRRYFRWENKNLVLSYTMCAKDPEWTSTENKNTNRITEPQQFSSPLQSLLWGKLLSLKRCI